MSIYGGSKRLWAGGKTVKYMLPNPAGHGDLKPPGDLEPEKGGMTMRFMMMMIPRVYQPDTPQGEKAGEGFSPPAETVARMMKFNEELANAGALIALDGLHPCSKGATVQAEIEKRKAS